MIQKITEVVCSDVFQLGTDKHLCAISVPWLIYGLEKQELPVDMEPLELTLFRSATTGDQPEIRWFHERVAEAAQAMELTQF